MAALLAHHRASPERRCAGDDPVVAGRQSQQLHHSLCHDRWRPSRRVGDLDHPHLPDRIRPYSVWSGLGLFGHSLPCDDVGRIFLRQGVDPRRQGQLMNSTVATPTSDARDVPARIADRPRLRRRDPWRIVGNIFLVVLTLFAILPMVWMFLTSIKSQFAAVQYPPEWLPHNPTLAEYVRLLSPTN